MNFCNELARSLRQASPPAMWHTSGHGMTAAIEGRLHCADETARMRFYAADGCLVLVHLRGQLRTSVFVDDFEHRSEPFQAGTVFALDLRRTVELSINESAHVLAIHIPRAALAAAAVETGTAENLRALHTGFHDAVLLHMAMSIIQTVRDPLLGDNVLHGQLFRSFLLRLTTLMGTPAQRPHLPRRTLTAREIDSLIEVVRHRLTRGLTVTEAAAACGLTHATFERAFRQGVGIAPNQWLILRRLDVAMGLIITGEQSLAEIAVEAGFADQSHFTHAFSRRLAVAPAAWRRLNASRQGAPA
ncbi:AraC family transcriptional regulator [Bacillus sp. NP157]|nr:AraC family transcriptional regulator [Bacillus sp. NP157]